MAATGSTAACCCCVVSSAGKDGCWANMLAKSGAAAVHARRSLQSAVAGSLSGGGRRGRHVQGVRSSKLPSFNIHACVYIATTGCHTLEEVSREQDMQAGVLCHIPGTQACVSAHEGLSFDR